ncbi:diaminobutyrate acetyltransferase [Allonocardiopsis opalescens]|uniref:L-2,4-diaminobutyric acid acetyltransferase n=1 Tax=Allonocardiopsis opalescens TaxID=1144618 RepID=A0A2T0Q9S3_9ACTN|nr:diaminobutyrate acetyltransferase [Allonocardiopsis opalescens]PRY00551.1 diaminobutyrate acetyltransferase [Allonocardiopsis opalescens]
MPAKRADSPSYGIVEEDGLRLDEPRVEDGPELWRVARDTPELDLNSPYSYVLWCRDFADTSVVVRDQDNICAFLTGYVRPESPGTFFVWQVAVHRDYRGRRLGRRMLDHYGRRMVRRGCTHLEATVTPGNTASLNLFRSYARDHAADLDRSTLFDADLFPGGHEPEELLRIGPLTAPDGRPSAGER